jgi:hypothetical protein
VINILLISPNPTVPNGTIESAHHQYFIDQQPEGTNWPGELRLVGSVSYQRPMQDVALLAANAANKAY